MKKDAFGTLTPSNIVLFALENAILLPIHCVSARSTNVCDGAMHAACRRALLPSSFIVPHTERNHFDIQLQQYFDAILNEHNMTN